MNCKAVRNLLLHAEHPERPPSAASDHLAQCSPCRLWQERLLQLERSVPRLSVPPSHAKAELLRKLEREPIAPRKPVVQPTRSWVLAFIRSPAMGPGVLAAGLLIFAFTWWMMQGPRGPQPVAERQSPAPDQLVANLMNRNLRLAQAKTPSERVAILADLAEDLRKETHELARAADTEDLTTLAQLYAQVVREGVVERAQRLDPVERRRVLEPIVARLDSASKEADRLARDLPKASAVLQAIASAASDGHDQLRALLGKGTS